MTDEPDYPFEEAERVVERHVNSLMEHFDAVHIFAIKNDLSSRTPDNPRGVTISLNNGAGIFHARTGYVREWLIMQDERARQFIIQKDREDKEEDDE